MTLFYAILAFVMAVYNFQSGLNRMDIVNLVFAVLWLCLGIYYAVKHFKERNGKKEKE